MEPLAKRLKEKLDKMSPEELQKKYDKYSQYEGPTCEEFLQAQEKYMLSDSILGTKFKEI